MCWGFSFVHEVFHARNTSRKENLKDVFNRAMDSSDPYISSMSLNLRQYTRKRKPLPKKVIDLLEEPEIPQTAARQLFEEEDAEEEVMEEAEPEMVMGVQLDREPYDFED